MADFFDFIIYVLSSSINFLFGLDVGLPFSYGDALAAQLVLSVLVGALVIRFRSGRL